MSTPKPKITNFNETSVEISWDHLIKQNSPTLHILQIRDDLKEWGTIYWGKKTTFKLKNLNPLTTYELRLKEQHTDDWLYFKTGITESFHTTKHLSHAIKFGKTAVMRKIAHTRPYLLEAENKDAKTPLIQAVEQGDLHLVNLLITLGSNVNSTSLNSCRTPLMVAVYLGQLAIAALLVDKGGDVMAVDVNGLNVLHYAIDSDDVENVRFALQQGVDVDSRDKQGWTPLLRAAILKCDQKIIDLLLENGADRSITDVNGMDFDKHLKIAYDAS